MFTGVGGFELGIERASYNKSSDEKSQSSKQEEGTIGRIRDINEQSVLLHSGSNSTSFRCVGFSEIDKYASELLTKKYPNTKNFGDCTKINTDELPDFDFLCGGFPCQAFSIAGKRRGFQDTRGPLFFEIARILEVKKPKIILLENVKGLLNHNKGETFKVILQTLDELGYEIQWMVLNSKFFGVPQNRERVFIIGSLRGEHRPKILPFGNSNEQDKPTMEFKGGVKSGQMWLDNGKQFSRNFPQGQRIYGTEGISAQINALGGGWGAKTGLYAMPLKFLQRNQKNLQGEYSFTVDGANSGGVMIKGNVNPSGKGMNGNVYSSEGIAPTIDTNKGEGKKIMNDIQIRRLTPLECERLQGFPEGHTEGFSDTQRYKMMGNAVTVNVIQAIINKMFVKEGVVIK